MKPFFERSIKGSERDPCRVELHEVKTQEGERKEKKKKKNGEYTQDFRISAHTSSLTLTVCYFTLLSKEKFMENNRLAATGYCVKYNSCTHKKGFGCVSHNNTCTHQKII